MIKKIAALSSLLLLLSMPALPESGELGVAVIDDFEATNPYGFYTVKALDSSSASLYVSHKAKVDGAAMQVNYSLSTTRSSPSKVEITREPALTDWSNITELQMWVKGDASGNIFKIFIIDDDEEVYEYEDHNILLNDVWTEFRAPLESFVLTTRGIIGNKVIDLGNIRYVGYVIEGRTPEAISGIISVDDLVGAGADLPKRASTKVGLPKGRVKVTTNLTAISRFRSTPENNSEWFNIFTVKLAGQAANYSAYIELSPDNDSSEAGRGITDNESASYPVSGLGLGSNWVNTPAVGQANFLITASDPIQYLSSLQIGRLWVDYGDYVYSPRWGYEGMQGEGKINKNFEYHGFIIKHIYDAATYGTRLNMKYAGFESRLMYVYSNIMGRRSTDATDASTVSSSPTDKKTVKISDDAVMYFEAQRKFGNALVLKGVYAADTYKQDAYASLSSYSDPVYLGPMPNHAKINETDFLKIGRMELYPLPGSAIHFEYRDIGDKYLPRWRVDRNNYDNDRSNQKGTSLYVSQDIPWGFTLSGLAVDIKRKANDAYYKHSRRGGIAHKPFRGVEASFTREYLDDYNYHDETRYGYNTYRNMEVYINNLWLTYEFSQTSRMSANYGVWQGYDRGLGQEMANHSMKAKLEEWFSANAYMSAEYTYSQYSNPADVPQGYPFDDNRIQVEVNLNF
jgi:hypothetical protein